MTDYDWPTIRTQAVERFGGDPPGPQLEQDIIDVFRTHPQTVVRSIDRIAAAWDAGKVRSPWAVLRHEIREAATPAEHVTATDTTGREQAIQRAEQWLHAAGVHLDRISEVEHELFGTATIEPTVTKDNTPIESAGTQLLAGYRDDQTLRTRIIQLWQQLRPRGIQIEQDAEARGQAHRNRLAAEHAERQRTHNQRLAALQALQPEPQPADDDPEPQLEPGRQAAGAKEAA